MDCEESCLWQVFFGTSFEAMLIENYLMYLPTSCTDDALDDCERQLSNRVMIYEDLGQQD